MFKRIRAAAVNFVPWKWHRDWNADRLESLFAEAAGCGVDLAVAPEGILEGYVANEPVHIPELREAMLAVAEPIDGPCVQRFRKLARKLKTCLVFGMAELRGRRDVCNTALFIDHRGTLCGTHQKMRFAEGYDPSWNFNRLGNRLRAFDTPLGRCGMLICADRWHPSIAGALALDGARFLCIPTYGNRGKGQDAAVLARARENGVAIVQANVGKNLIISKGEIVARDRRTDAITVADVDIPLPPGTRAARTLERRYLAERPAEMAALLAKTRERTKTFPVAHTGPDHARKPRTKPTVIHDHVEGTLRGLNDE